VSGAGAEAENGAEQARKSGERERGFTNTEAGVRVSGSGVVRGYRKRCER